MGNLFNVNNGFFTFMSKFWDLVLVNIMWLICAIPTIFGILAIGQLRILFLVVAIPAAALLGPATTALYYATIKSIRRDRGYVTREFFRSFKSNFKVATIVSFIFFVLGFILYIDFQWTYSQLSNGEGGTGQSVMMSLFIAIAIITALLGIWCFPILSRFTLGVKQLFKTTFLIAVRHFPTSFAAMVLFVVALLGLYLIWELIIFIPGLLCFLYSFLFERVFKKYMPKPEGTPEETGEDQWYWE